MTKETYLPRVLYVQHSILLDPNFDTITYFEVLDKLGTITSFCYDNETATRGLDPK